MNAVIIYGPGGSGKTHHREAFRKHFGCVRIVEDWTEKVQDGDLVLTCLCPPFRVPEGVRVIEITEAKRLAGIA